MRGCLWKWGIQCHFNGEDDDILLYQTSPSIVRNIKKNVLVLSAYSYLLSLLPIFLLAMFFEPWGVYRQGSSVGWEPIARLGKGEADCKEPFVARWRRWDHMGSNGILPDAAGHFFQLLILNAIDRSDRCAIFPAEVLSSPFVEIDGWHHKFPEKNGHTLVCLKIGHLKTIWMDYQHVIKTK